MAHVWPKMERNNAARSGPMKAVRPFVWSQVLLKSRSRIKVILAIFKAYSASTTRLLASAVNNTSVWLPLVSSQSFAAEGSLLKELSQDEQGNTVTLPLLSRLVPDPPRRSTAKQTAVQTPKIIMLESHWEECVGSGCNLTDELADIYLITPENHEHNSGFVSGNKVACLLAADAYFGFIASQIRLYLRRHICMSWSNTGKKKNMFRGRIF